MCAYVQNYRRSHLESTSHRSTIFFTSWEPLKSTVSGWTLFKKSVPSETVTRSVSLVLVSIGLICLVLFMILAGNAVDDRLVNDTQGAFLKFLFETVSAFGTVGLSMGVTPELNLWGKCWIIVMMIIGRVGVLTFSYIVVGNGAENGIEHSEENLMIG